MSTGIILTAYMYKSHDGRRYIDENFIRGDLKVVFDYCMNVMGVGLHNIHVFTNIIPNTMVRVKIENEFKQAVENNTRKIGYDRPMPGHKDVKSWLRALIHDVSKTMGESVDRVQKYIFASTFIVSKLGNILEYMSIFCNVSFVTTRREYMTRLTNLIDTFIPDDRLVFYYSGHGSRHDNTINILISDPQSFRATPHGERQNQEYISTSDVDRILSRLPAGLELIIIFDCCYAEQFCGLPVDMLNTDRIYPGRSTIPCKTVFVGSCKRNQQCDGCKRRGFTCSTFTCHLFEKSISLKPCDIQKTSNVIVRSKTQTQSPQQIVLYTNQFTSGTLFPWIGAK